MNDKKQLDGWELHMLQTEGIFIEPLWMIEHRQRIQEINERYEYNNNPENIPTWMSFETWCTINKKR